MKHILRSPALVISAAVIVVAGCAGQPDRASRATEANPRTQTSPVPATHSEEPLPPGVGKPPLPFEGEGWQTMFAGQTLAGWRETEFAGRGEVQCRSGVIVLNMGDPFTGISWTNEFPKVNYEVALDAMRVMGSDFFCGLTVPVGTNFCSLIVGGWGGTLVGISSLDGMDASENETTKFVSFEQGRWYRIRLRVTEGRIQAWVDQDKVADVDTTDKRVSVRPGDIELSKPFGLAAWQTTAALREIKWRPVEQPEPRRQPRNP